METSNFKEYANIASSAQKVVEKLLEELFLYAHKITKEKDLYFQEVLP